MTHIRKTIFLRLSLAMLLLLSMAFFVLPAKQTFAQSGGGRSTKYACVNPDVSGAYQRAYIGGSSPECQPGWTLVPIAQDETGFCVGSKIPVKVIPQSQVTGPDRDGHYHYIDPQGQAYNCTFVTYTSITAQYTPGGGTGGTGGGTNPPIKPPVNAPGSTTAYVACEGEPGFHKQGPLCVPNSPFTKGIAGDPSSQTASGLAVRIIRILLYFAGIVAVIMAIIGGYQVMTAAGNDTQAANGKKTLTNAIIGLVIVILSYIIIQAVIAFATK